MLRSNCTRCERRPFCRGPLRFGVVAAAAVAVAAVAAVVVVVVGDRVATADGST